MAHIRGIKAYTGAFIVVSVLCGPSYVLAGGRSDLEDNGGGGVSKIGGVLADLPPCQIQGNTIVHHNRSCVYIPTADNDGKANDGDQQKAESKPSADGFPASAGSGMRGGGGDVTGTRNNINNENPGDDDHKDPYDRDGKYWLVPPFMIGASSVIVVYILAHCLYLHCYTKRKMRQMALRSPAPPAFVFSDGDGPSTSSLHAYTPLVKYDGGPASYGKTELLENQSFVLYQNLAADGGAGPDYPPSELDSRRSSRRKSSFLQLPNFFGRRSSATRPSICSNMSLERPSQADGGDAPLPVSARPRPSVCLVPVSRTVSDPTGGSSVKGQEWMPMHGFVYPSGILPSSASLATTGASENSAAVAAGSNREDVGVLSPPFFLVPQTFVMPDDQDQTTKGAGGATATSECKEGINEEDDDCETITIAVPSLKETTPSGTPPNKQ